ncbi:MAG: hypothetical protein HYY44_07595 [Deltaproteobacteria bacterium]|nr:hypothetical protein [Deltaproteobacteria bacterium]
MPIDGIRQNQPATLPEGTDDLSRQNDSPHLVQTTSLQTQRGLLMGQSTSNATASDIANPGQGNMARQLEQETYQLEQLQGLRNRLAPLAQAGDRNAADLVAEIDQILPALEQQIARQERALATDTDGDGVYDGGDPDADGDLLTNERELRDGTDPYNADSDGDGITDDNEIRLYNLGRALIAEGHVEEGQALMRRGNALSGDGDRDGIIDSAQLDEEVRVQLGMTEATGEGGSTSGSTGTQSQSSGGSNSSSVSNSAGDETASPFENLEARSERQTSQGVQQMTFDMEGSADFNFRMMEEIGGQEAKQWTLNADDDDLILEAKNRSGDLIGRFILENGNTDAIRSQLQFRLHDSGQRVDSDVDVTIHGGSGDDLIYSVGGAGSRIFGEGGSDMVVIGGSVDGNGAFIDGGDGNDILQGGDADDRIQGGAGNDFIYGAQGENTLLGQGGNDAVFSAHNQATGQTAEVVEGGTGIDISNAFHGEVSGIETGIRDLNGLVNYLSQYGLSGGSSPIELQEILRAQREDIPYAQALMSEGLEGLALEYLIQKDQERQSWYTPLPGTDQYQYQSTQDSQTNPGYAGQEEAEDDPGFFSWDQ